MDHKNGFDGIKEDFAQRLIWPQIRFIYKRKNDIFFNITNRKNYGFTFFIVS